MLVKSYALYDGKKCLGIFTGREVHEKTGININSISRYADVGTRYRKRFKIEYAGRIENNSEPVYRKNDFPRRWKEMQQLFQKKS